MPFRPKGDPRPEDVTLGIDLGSYSTRAALRTASGQEFVVENKESMNPDNTYYAADFPSTIYPFDDISRPVYLLNPDHSRQETSAKYAFYVLAGADDKLLEEYPVARHLTDRQHDAAFHQQLRRGIVSLLKVVRDATIGICKSKRYRIVKIGLAIPVQWTFDFEEAYRSIILEVFWGEIEASNVCFYAETETFGRYSYKFHSREIDPEDKHSSVICFDFGGHNMNGCLFGVARDFNQQVDNSFFTVGKPFGVGGGSEQWEHHIGQWIANQHLADFGTPLPPRQLQKAFADFQAIKRQEEPSWGTTWYFDLPDGGAWRVPLTKDTIDRAWEEGLGRPLELMKRQLSRLANLEKEKRISTPLVVVSGGSARGPKARACIQALCKEANVDMIFTDGFLSVNYRTAQIAMAAAYVASETITVEEFFLRGAAVGLQRCAIGPRTQTRNIAWDSWGPLLLDGVNATHGKWADKVNTTMSHIHLNPNQKGHSGSVVSPELKALQKDIPLIFMTTTGRDRFRLICDPFFIQRPPPHKPEVHADRSYDLAYLGAPSKGTWAFLATLAGSGDAVELYLHQWYLKNMSQAWVRQKTIRMPLYSEGSCNCVTIGVDGHDLNDLIKELDLGLPPQPEEDPNDDPQDMDDCKESSVAPEPSVALEPSAASEPSVTSEQTIASRFELRVASEPRVVSDVVDVEPSAPVSAKKNPANPKILTPGPIRWRNEEKRPAKAKPYQRPQRIRAPSRRLSESLESQSLGSESLEPESLESSSAVYVNSRFEFAP